MNLPLLIRYLGEHSINLSLAGLLFAALAFAFGVRKPCLAGLVMWLVVVWAGALVLSTRWYHQLGAKQCRMNLVILAKAKQIRAAELDRKAAEVPATSELMGVGKPLHRLPACPLRGRYELGNSGDSPRCSHEPFYEPIH